MGQTTKIEWADSTWNPVTGCLHGCEYCYARRIAERFGGHNDFSTFGEFHSTTGSRLFEVYEGRPLVNIRYNEEKRSYKATVAPYPFYFQPTLRRDRLNQYERKEGRTIFVCSMADLFGDWVPDEWIEEVFAACRRAPQHRYLFLTKNPERYIKLAEQQILPEDDNMWYGTTVTTQDEMYFFSKIHNTFISVEPMHGAFNRHADYTVFPRWVIIGAETGNRKDKVTPKPEWVQELAKTCIENSSFVFMKESLLPIIGEENMFREIPWDEGTWEIERQQQWLERHYEEGCL